MSIDTISDALSRISSIEQQLQQLENGSLLDSELGVSGSGASSSSGDVSGTTSSTDFADELAQAQSGSTTSATDGTDTGDVTGDGDGATSTSGTSGDSGAASFGSLDDTALASAASGSSGGFLTGGVGLSGGVTLTAAASSQLTSGQQQFASTLSADTGLNPSVVSAWLLAEESGSAAASREATGNNDWLNIGYTDSGTYGASDAVWSDPVSAANATAQWLQGQSSIPGYGNASSGIQAILSSVGQTPATQVQAIQDSGWSSGGYPNLESLYATVASGSEA